MKRWVSDEEAASLTGPWWLELSFPVPINESLRTRVTKEANEECLKRGVKGIKILDCTVDNEEGYLYWLVEEALPSSAKLCFDLEIQKHAKTDLSQDS